MDDPCFIEDTKESKHCQNDGVCERIEDHFKCICKDGFVGTRCENINYCVQKVNVSFIFLKTVNILIIIHFHNSVKFKWQ